MTHVRNGALAKRRRQASATSRAEALARKAVQDKLIDKAEKHPVKVKASQRPKKGGKK